MCFEIPLPIKFMVKKLIVRVFIGFLIAVGTCTSGEARKVRLGIPVAGANMIAFFAARDGGYYRDEGLDVEIITIRTPIANTALIARELDFGVVTSAALVAALRGAPLRVLSAQFYRPLFWLYAKPGILSIKELKGKKLSSSGPGSAPHVLLDAILRKHGLGGVRDATIIVMPGDARVNSLQAGFIDAAVLALPWNLLAEESGLHQLASFVKEDAVLLTGSIITRETLIRSDRSLVEKFIRGTQKGFLYVQKNRQKSIDLLSRITGLKEHLAAKTYDLMLEAMTLDGTVNESLLKNYFDIVPETRGVEFRSLTETFDFSLTKKIAAELKSEGWMPKTQ